LKRKGAGYHHGDLRRALVEATIRLVDDHGTEGFTLRAAAKLAGVSDGAPYHHFADKEALLATVAAESLDLLCDAVTAAAADERGDPCEQCCAMGVAYLQFAARHPARFRLMFGPWHRASQGQRSVAESTGRVSRLVKQAFVRGLAGGEGQAARTATEVTWAFVHGLSTLALDGHVDGGTGGFRKSERLMRVALGQLLPGMTALETTPKSIGRTRGRGLPKTAPLQHEMDDAPKSARRRRKPHEPRRVAAARSNQRG